MRISTILNQVFPRPPSPPRRAGMTRPFWSVLAGFVEPGETLERRLDVVDGKRDVPVRRAELGGVDAGGVRQVGLRLRLAGEAAGCYLAP